MRARVGRVVLTAGLLVGVACGASDVRLAAVGPSPVVAGERDPLPVKSTTTSTSTTTTIPLRSVTTRASRGGRRYHGNPAGSYNGYPCGGDLPYCSVLERESHGDPTAKNWGGCNSRGCFGLWQFDPRTWANYAGYSRADLAPAGVQNEKARLLWAGGRGCLHWSACG